MSTALEIAEFKKAAGIEPASKPRAYQSKRMTGFNAEVYSAWIDRWANNAAVNYPIINDSWGVRFLTNSCKKLPAVVVGIGPSFDDNIDALKCARQRAIVIATDAALRPMLRHGIKPDIVVNYDGRHEQCTMWDSIDTRDLVLVANSVTSPRTIDAWKGKIIFFNMMQADDEFATNILPAMYPHLGELPNMGTVGNGAIYLASQMGCDPIITVGMDLCYRRTNKPNEAIDPAKPEWRYRCDDYIYLKPTPEFPEGNWAVIENKVLYDNAERMKNTGEVTHKGQTFRVDEALKFYHNSLIGHIGNLDLPVIDTSGGTLSPYVKHMGLMDALMNSCKENIYDGRTVVRHLNKITKDCKRGRRYDEKDFWQFSNSIQEGVR